MPIEEWGGFRGSGHLWAGMGAPWLRDAPPLVFRSDGACPVSKETAGWVSTSDLKIWRSENLKTRRRSDATLEPHEHWLRLEHDAPRFLHAVLDFIFQADNIARLRVSSRVS